MQAHVRFGSLADIGAQIAMSAIPPKADIQQTHEQVRFVPFAAIRIAALAPSFEYLVDADER